MKFADFDVDPVAGVLRRNGVRVKLQDLPFRLLVVLLRRAGTSCTREELRAELWGAETFVDAEAGLNTAIAKLREALGDNADAPVFIQTLPKRGYRFIGTLVPDGAASGGTPDRATRGRRASRPWLVVLAGFAVVVLSSAGYFALRGPDRISIAVVRFHNETGIADNDRLAGTLTDAVVVSLADDPRYGVIGNSPLLRTERIFQDVRKIGGALHADYVVLGQLQNVDGGLVTRAHFIRVSDETHLWAGKIELAGVTDTERAVTTAVAAGIVTGLSRKR
jgi:DNA-binding winged helix-turn-helix (wHTH) protein/TolB-like protein